MRTEILICSYDKDIGWLQYCLRSIRKFATGFGGTTVLVPDIQESLFTDLQKEFGFTLKSYPVPEDRVKWHIAHQCEKCHAEFHCQEADLICFVDSDCTFVETVTPHDYFVYGKPVLLIRPYELSGGGAQWKPVVDKALGLDSKFETMARHPAVHYRDLFPEVRKRVSEANGMPFRDYVLSCKPDFPYFFSEFNVLGNAVLTSDWKDKYHLIDLATEPRPKDLLHQCWSYAPPDQEQTMPSTGERGVPMDLFKKLGLVDA